VPVADARTYIAGKLREQKMAEQAQAYAKKLLDNSGIVFHIALVEPPAESQESAGGQGAPGGAPASSQDQTSSSDTSTPAASAPAPSAPDSSDSTNK
jgi:hypothetical protein